jgi:glycosyltransferase involved in cell wall biosynthesis
MEPAGRRAGAGSVTAYVPDIGSLIPVYVLDRYRGFEVKTFLALTDAELATYLERNVAAVRDVAEAAGGVDAALANHLVMGPAILARAGLDFAAKIHGSALEYTVKPHYRRFAPYASEGLAHARAVLVGSRHTAESLWAAMPLGDLPHRTRLGPPGVDTQTFAPRNRSERRATLDALIRWLEAAERTGFDASAAEALDHLSAQGPEPPPDGEALAAVRNGYDDRGIDAELPFRLDRLDPGKQPLVCYVGKLIVSKGVDLLIAAWPLVLARNPKARLVIVGFGTYREGLELLLRGLEEADERLLMHVIRHGRELEGGQRGELTYLRAFFESLEGRHERFFAAARRIRRNVIFTGRLEHGEVARLLPLAEAVVVPSMFPEAFGMVAAEAAACGALPVCAAHSGLAEVAGVLARGLPSKIARLLTFERGMQAVDQIADSLNSWLDLDERTRESARRRLVQTSRESFSWEKVADGVVKAAQGKLGLLEPVPGDVPFAMTDAS